jgi:hypothetical protein
MIFAFTNAFYMSELAKRYADPFNELELQTSAEKLYDYYHSFQNSYQGLFGQFKFDEWDEGQYGIFYIFSFCITLLMLNILIAIIGDAYSEGLKNVD